MDNNTDNMIGRRLDGRYELLELIGTGGMADIYKAKDITEDRIVAVKILKNEFAGSEDFLRRFRNESKAIALLSHPNIVKIYDVGFNEQIQFIVMEYIDGMSLKAYLSKNGDKIPWEQAIAILQPIMEALVQVHGMNLLHRDISPDNIYITTKGESRLLDFGAARFSIGDEKSVSVILKHGYAPEEQYSSKGNQGPWTDVYAMGATLYRCVTGELPPDSIMRVHNDTLKKPSELGVPLPPQVEQAIMKALAVKAEDRFSTMEAFIEGITGKTPASFHHRTMAVPSGQTAAGSDGKPGLWTRFRRSHIGVQITALVLCVAVLGLGVWGAVAGIGALTGGKAEPGSSDGPSGTPFDITVQEPEGVDDVALQDYAQEYLNITMGIPQGYAETESGSGAFASSDGSATLQVGFYDKAAVYPF